MQIRLGSPFPLGATWDGRGTNRDLLGQRREDRALPVRPLRPPRARAHHAAGSHRRCLACLLAGSGARSSLWLPGFRPLRARTRPPLQSSQAAARSLCQTADGRRPLRLLRHHRKQPARECFSHLLCDPFRRRMRCRIDPNKLSPSSFSFRRRARFCSGSSPNKTRSS